MPSPERLRGEWEELKTGAAKERRSVFEMSSLIALSTVRNLPENVVWLSKVARSATLQTGHFFADGLLDHYSATLQEIRGAGFRAYWVGSFARICAPPPSNSRPGTNRSLSAYCGESANPERVPDAASRDDSRSLDEHRLPRILILADAQPVTGTNQRQPQ